MTLMQRFRRSVTVHPRALAAVLAVLWFGVIGQPCAMAFGGTPVAGCPHCPPAVEAPHADHAHAGAAHADAAESTDASHCATALADCGQTGGEPYDGRSAKSAAKDLPIALPVARLPHAAELSGGVDAGIELHSAALLPGRPPSPFILFCSQLK